MNLTAVLLTGLLAGGVSCAAVQGGLLAGLITRQRQRPRRAEQTTVPAGGPHRPLSQSPKATLADDLTPVAAFLTGKLLSHALLGALLGAVGTAVQLSVRAHTVLQLLAGALIIIFGLAQLGVRGFRRIRVDPPDVFGRIVLRSARAETAFAPALFGLASILIPCGVTLSVEALALTSGSPVAGAITMAVFVVGTSPLFALLGYAARKAATAWRGRLAVATGLLVVAMGFYTVNGGLELADSPLAASHLFPSSTSAEPVASGQAAGSTVADGYQTITITATGDGYTPQVHAKAGLPTSLVIDSRGAEGCIQGFTVPARNLQQILPSTGVTRIALGTLTPGTLDYVCAMGMYTGKIIAN